MSRMSDLDLEVREVDFYTSNRRLAVASLIGECEAIAGSGVLTEPAEQSLRLLIAETLSAFGMQHNQQYDHYLAIIRQCMERS